MPTLHEIQTAFAHVLLGKEASAVSAAVLSDGMSREARLNIYRNNVMVSLKDVLKSTFPVVFKLVGERFFLYATEDFIHRHPPRRPCLDEFGAGFGDFLETFPPCRELVYLADVARLEWLLHAAYTAPGTEPIAPSALAGVDARTFADVAITLDPSLGYLASPWPVDRIWRANQHVEDDGVICLDGGGVRLEVRRSGSDVGFRTLDPATFAFRKALADGGAIANATAAALAVESDFDLTGALRALLQEGAPVGYAVRIPEPEMPR